MSIKNRTDKILEILEKEFPDFSEILIILEKEFPDSEIIKLDTMRKRHPRYVWIIKEHWRQSESSEIPSAQEIMDVIELQIEQRRRKKFPIKSKSKQKVTQKKIQTKSYSKKIQTKSYSKKIQTKSYSKKIRNGYST